VSVQEFLTIGYAIVSPSVLIHRDGHLVECYCAQQKRLGIEKRSVSVIFIDYVDFSVVFKT
jgi:hypothetical protein